MRRTLLPVLCLVLALGASVAHGSLMAIDLGSEYLRAVLVMPSGRGSPLQIVSNEMSRRKSPALVGIAGEDRLLGEEAFSFAIRYPTTVFARTRDLLGRSAGDAYVQNLLKAHSLPYDLVDHPDLKTVMAKVNATTAYLAEELVAGVLQYAKQIADAQAGAPVVDAVVTVPAWFGVAQRQALKDAAALAGLNVLALVNSHSAAALQFGIERDFAAKEQKVVFYDMGSGSTEVALVRYSTYLAKEPGSSKPKPVNQFEVLDADWDATLGSNDLDALLAGHFAAKFEEKAGVDVRTIPKAMAKLRRQVRRTKEILSANNDAPFSVEELHDGADFASSVTRAELEELAEKAGFWARAAAPLKRLLERNSLKPADVDAVELLGGGSRVPRLQAALTDALGGRGLDRHLDADEAVVLGGALFAANLSTSFRLRKFGMTDVAMYGVAWESDAGDLLSAAHAGDGDEQHAAAGDAKAGSGGGPLVKNLLPAGKKLPVKRAVKFSNLTADGFSFRLAYNESAPHGLPPGHVGSLVIAEYSVSGIKAAIERYNSSGTTALRFDADWSGLVALDKAECLVEVEAMEEQTVEVPAEPEAAAEDKDKKEKDAGKKEDDKKGDDKKDDSKKDADKKDDAKKGADKKEDKPKTVTKTVLVPRKRMMHVALTVDGPKSAHAPLAGAPLDAARKSIAAFGAREAAKRETARARNDLEAYILATRESLESEAVVAVTTDEQRSEFREALMDAEDWLYGDGDGEPAAGLRKRLAGLRATGAPIARRAAELAARPAAVQEARAAAEGALARAAAWAKDKPWINATEAEPVVAKVKEFLSWLQEQEAAQAKKAAHEDPAFDSDTVAVRWEVAARAFDRVDSKRKPRPPVVKASANATANGTAGANATEGAGAGAGAEADGDKQQQQQQQQAEEEEPSEQPQEQQEEAGDDAAADSGSGSGSKDAEAADDDEPDVHEEL